MNYITHIVRLQYQKNEEFMTLKEFRKQLNLTKQQIAEKIGVSLSFYEKIESGSREASRAFMLKLKKAFPEADISAMFFNI